MDERPRRRRLDARAGIALGIVVVLFLVAFATLGRSGREILGVIATLVLLFVSLWGRAYDTRIEWPSDSDHPRDRPGA